MRGNLNTPRDAVATVVCRNVTSLGLSPSGYGFVHRTVARSFEPVSICRTVSNVMRLAFVKVYQKDLNGQHAGITCTPQTEWSRWVCRNVTEVGVSPSGCGFVRRTVARRFEPVSNCLNLPTRLGQSAYRGNLHSPLWCSGRSESTAILQGLGCHLAVVVLSHCYQKVWRLSARSYAPACWPLGFAGSKTIHFASEL